MPDSGSPSGRPSFVPYLFIASVVAIVAAAFAYTAGWLSPARLTPSKIVNVLAPPDGPALGFRRNHAKGVCFTGTFEANGNGRELSTAKLLEPGSYPVTGRFNLATPNPKAIDGMERVRGLSLRVVGPDRQEWRTAMIDAPFFPVATPQDFYALQVALADKGDPEAIKRFAGAHPGLVAFGGWAASAPFTSSYLDDRYHGINSFLFTDASGRDRAVRWAFVPLATPAFVSKDELIQRDPDFLSKDLAERVAKQPAKFTMAVTVAEAGDVTADPSKAWPEGRRTIDVGTLVVARVEPEPDGPCRDVNFDPTVLPVGIKVSDDPFPAARSAAYAVSFDRRTAEEKHYPRTQATTGSQPDPLEELPVITNKRDLFIIKRFVVLDPALP